MSFASIEALLSLLSHLFGQIHPEIDVGPIEALPTSTGGTGGLSLV